MKAVIVPCFIRWPGCGLRAPTDLDTLAQGQDLAPTLVNLCGLRMQEGVNFDGFRLARSLRGREQPELRTRTLVVQYGRHSPHYTLPLPPVAKWDCVVMWNKWRLVNGEELYLLSNDPHQRESLHLSYSNVMQTMRQYYEEWWSRMQPSLSHPVPITVGSAHENPTRLSGEDWFNVPFSYVSHIRQGSLLNGLWNILVEAAAEYEIHLRRWPREVDTALDNGLPAYTLHDRTWGSLGEGKALPITRARLRVGVQDESKPVAPGTNAVAFRVKLNTGTTTLQTWLYNAFSQELCGAWYTSVRRL